MKSRQLLRTLEAQIDQLTTRVAPLAHHATLSARFDHQLFSTCSSVIQSYLDEIKYNFSTLQHAVRHQRLAQVCWLTQRLSAQMTALNREAATWSLRRWDSPSAKINRWQQRRLIHQQYEHRLATMYHEHQQQLAQATTFAEQQRLAREVDIYAGRLANCRAALQKIERVLARLTR
ncbi:primosomal replication protein [Enterobacteriaceae bacterium ESL0689]|nr:primosomal replication protein [Enterobacteriaceae bacterium ESL0689]